MAENRSVVYKVVFAGKYGVGKTSLFRRIFGMGFDDKKPSGIGSKLYSKTFAEDKMVIQLEIWDTAEMERHGSITQSYYRGSHFALLVYAANDEASMKDLESIADDVRNHEPSAKLFLVRNKTDLPIGKEGISIENQDKYISHLKHKMNGVFLTSAKENEGVKELLQHLANYALQLSKRRTQKKVDPWYQYIDPSKREPSTKQGCCS